MGALTAGVTNAVFTSQATVENNTFATGTLEIRVNGQPSIAGFDFQDAAPGDCVSGQFGVNNYGDPYFAGPSTIAAKSLKISAMQDGGNTYLYEKLRVKIEANRGWSDWMMVYEGKLMHLTSKDLLAPRWMELAPGHTEDVRYEVCLPMNADDSYQGLSTTFDMLIDAKSSP